MRDQSPATDLAREVLYAVTAGGTGGGGCDDFGGGGDRLRAVRPPLTALHVAADVNSAVKSQRLSRAERLPQTQRGRDATSDQ